MLMHEELSHEIIGAAIDVHRELGPGLLESAYEMCLCHELTLRNLAFERQIDVPVIYKGVRLDCGYRLDILVEQQIVLEIKCVQEVLPVHKAQLMTNLKLMDKRVGMLMNFNVPVMKDAILRRVR
jgi:GxxExxY protein